MILSDRDIAKEILHGDLVVEPARFDDIEPASLDVRLGNEFKFAHQMQEVVDIQKCESMEFDTVIVEDDSSIEIGPDDFVLATTESRFEMPSHLMASLEGRSSIGRNAISVHSTAGHIDPGFTGQITLEMQIDSSVPMKVTPGMRIAQLVFKELKTPAKEPYDKQESSKYNGQTGPTESRIDEDFD